METAGVNLKNKFYFIDESGDAGFYGKGRKLLTETGGFQPYLIIGVVETCNRQKLRKAIAKFIQKMKADVLYNSIYSFAESDWYLHARSDHPELRIQFFEFLRKLSGFIVHVVIAKKDLQTFQHQFNGNSTAYYFHVLQCLLNKCLIRESHMHNLYLANCGNHGLTQLKNAVSHMELEGERFMLDMLLSSSSLELSVTDYMIWAVQRKLLKSESRYFDALKDKFGQIIEM
ncbi:hypothetical protein [Chitinophaga caseinilytica]|uniref:hypothetical protein n=1 Tax=Chitinophaga caseinilytica TaxID=2267521 RepID=UPI003C2FE1D6